MSSGNTWAYLYIYNIYPFIPSKLSALYQWEEPRSDTLIKKVKIVVTQALLLLYVCANYLFLFYLSWTSLDFSQLWAACIIKTTNFPKHVTTYGRTCQHNKYILHPLGVPTILAQCLEARQILEDPPECRQGGSHPDLKGNLIPQNSVMRCKQKATANVGVWFPICLSPYAPSDTFGFSIISKNR